MGDKSTLWHTVKKIDPRYTKQVTTAGRQPFTNIDAYHLIEKATEQFGAYGGGWGIKEMSLDEVSMGDTALIKLTGTFFYPAGAFPVVNAIKLQYKTSKGYSKIDEEAYKKVVTNTIGKALSYLGFGADVYMGKFEDAAYVEEVANEFAQAEYLGYIDTIKVYIEHANDPEKVTAWVLERAAAERVETIEYHKAKEIAKLIKQKQKRQEVKHADTQYAAG